ncbi:YciI family protein [Nocardia camponoti]|uniref:YCII-related domain-containing protein n=1 Tax=Nocardia camponoti TaxID=1616106 RepID=A0A917QAM3_9NOCA|nr:YciI family protein [Nocardia camponoti]GGK39566.1 hypothetical protein GCM10011591_09090 [Nocardia camponoti]
MSLYLALIYGDETYRATMSAEDGAEIFAGHMAFQEIAGDAHIGGHPLQPSNMATSIRHDADGKAVITDGPFAEAKEALGGYYVIEAPDLDAAIALASKIPAPHGGIELRPIEMMN